MKGKTSYLLLQSIGSAQDFAFTSPLVNLFHEELTGHEHLMMDNFSDATLVEYAKKFVDKSDQVTIICEQVIADQLGSWLPVLNYAIKKDHVSLIGIGSSKLTAPFMKMKKGLIFENEAELREYLANPDRW
ncbi:hypothetical protein [Marinoscillum sp. MHG1-6]|uniref:hypothetical protein n=1 Tax=Marinoscillum sp. MHG1-6 TaxID=2959627 RepID=UPI00215881DE|nr:hypothetical protein [Marinoscillum sp. MHG1-6]